MPITKLSRKYFLNMKEQSEKKSQSPKPKDAPAVKMDNVKESKEENIGKGNSMSLCPATVSESGDGFACRYCPDVKESIEELERHEINVHGALKPKVVLPKKEEISRINDEFDKTLPDVQALAERFEFADEIKKARPLIKDMFKKRSFAVPDETQTKRNKNKLEHWIVDEYCNEYFQKEIGFTKDTYDSQLWPAKKVADILLKKLEIHFPGVMKDRKFCHALVRKFEDERQKHKDILKIEGPRKGAQAELEKQARIETEAEEARLEAEAAEKARPEPEAEAEEKARLKAEAAEKARLEAEAAEKAGLEAEAEAQAKAESEEKARLEAEAAEKARPEAEAERAKAKGEAEEHAGIEAEAQEQTRLEAAKPEKLIEPTVEKPAQVIEASEEAAKPEETQNDDTKEVKAVIGAAGAASIGATAAAVTANTKTKKPANPKTKKSAPGTN